MLLEVKKLQDAWLAVKSPSNSDEKALDFLVQKGDQAEFGARVVRRTVEQYLEEPLSDKILMHRDEGRAVWSTSDGEKLLFTDVESSPQTQ